MSIHKITNYIIHIYIYIYIYISAWEHYLKTMGKARTWGDELTIKACAEKFNLQIHVITSNESNYYIEYIPSGQEQDNAGSTGTSVTSTTSDKIPRHIFLAYISPIHYNSIVRNEPVFEPVYNPSSLKTVNL